MNDIAGVVELPPGVGPAAEFGDGAGREGMIVNVVRVGIQVAVMLLLR